MSEEEKLKELWNGKHKIEDDFIVQEGENTYSLKYYLELYPETEEPLSHALFAAIYGRFPDVVKTYVNDKTKHPNDIVLIGPNYKNIFKEMSKPMRVIDESVFWDKDDISAPKLS